MMRPHAATVLLALLLAGCSGGGAPAGQQPQAQSPPGSVADPAIRVALAVVALERDPEHGLTAAQAAKLLPWLRVLWEMRPDDREAAQAIADEAFAILTADQRAALERRREEARERSGQPGGQGAGRRSGRPGGPGGPPDPSRRDEFRRRIFDRAIKVLETKSP